jgi:hypothetical protein
MAELEVAKHGKNVIHLMTKKEHTVAHRIREIVIEMLTIVFAVSMSIWLHGLSEHHHQQQEVEAFLVGLKADLAADVRQLEGTRNSYHGFDANYAYLASLDPGTPARLEKFNDAYAGMNANWFFIPDQEPLRWLPDERQADQYRGPEAPDGHPGPVPEPAAADQDCRKAGGPTASTTCATTSTSSWKATTSLRAGA